MARLTLSATPTPRRTGVSTHGSELTFETLDAAEAAEAPLRRHRDDHVLLRVIDGILRLTVAGEERLLGIGDEAVIPAGASHRFASACGRTRIVTGLRPAPGT
jgi:quercetin dioxygenase-like cupin family protein